MLGNLSYIRTCSSFVMSRVNISVRLKIKFIYSTMAIIFIRAKESEHYCLLDGQHYLCCDREQFGTCNISRDISTIILKLNKCSYFYVRYFLFNACKI